MIDASAQLRKCFLAVFPTLTDAEISGATMESVEKWDSVATVTLLSLIEEEFALTVAPDDLDQLTSYESILDYLQRATKTH